METITHTPILSAPPAVPSPAVVPAGQGHYASLGDHRVWVKVSARDSAGTILIADLEADPGGGVPPHVHAREEENFFIQSGRFEFLIGEQTIQAGPGDNVFAPRDVPHAWRCISPEKGRAILVITPGANFEAFAAKMDAAGHDPRTDMADPARAAALMALTAAHGIHMLPALK